MRAHAKTIVILGIVLALSQVIGIPLLWKQWLSALIGIGCVGWGLYLRYGGQAAHTESHEQTPTIQ